LSGATLIPADQLDAIVLGMGATQAEAGAWGRAWERAMDDVAETAPSDGQPLPEAAPAHGSGVDGAMPAAGLPRTSRWTRRAVIASVAIPVTILVLVFATVMVWRSRTVEPTRDVGRTLATARTPVRMGCLPVTGDWDRRRDPATGVASFTSVTPGLACKQGPGIAWSVADDLAGWPLRRMDGFGNFDNCLPVTGDWDANGSTSVGVACGGGPEHVIQWALINGFAGSPSYPKFVLGDSDRCWPVTGDWNGDGRTTAGVACVNAGRITWTLIDGHGAGPPAAPVFAFGDAVACWPVSGDWDGDGHAGVGTACRDGDRMRWLLRNALSGGGATDVVFGQFDGCRPVTGDWDGDGSTGIGTACQSGDGLVWRLTNDAGRGGSAYPDLRLVVAAPSVAAVGWPGPGWPPASR
jgi:hypothetical protein